VGDIEYSMSPTSFLAMNAPHHNFRRSFTVAFALLPGALFVAGCSNLSEQHEQQSPVLPSPRRTERPSPVRRMRPATAQEAAAGQKVVRQHLRAFRDKNYALAINLEAVAFRQSHSTPEKYRKMIEENYAAFGRARNITWRRARVNDTDQTLWLTLNFSTSLKDETASVRYGLEANRGYAIKSIEADIAKPPNPHPWPFKSAF